MDKLRELVATQEELIKLKQQEVILKTRVEALRKEEAALAAVRGQYQEIINGEESITVDIAIRLGKALGNGPRLWLNLQQKVDIWDALQSHKEEYE
ncbi:HigA family addiction module antitoxin [Dolichospermum sp. ST_sed10]|nr:HigA family addiction module antitoxin [Dolichospermum sp. ST_sed10]